MTWTTRDDEPLGVCQQKHYRGNNLWEGRRATETEDDVAERHRIAKILCHRCPLLDVCEHALYDMERQGLRVDGVMAGRYSDVWTVVNKAHGEYQHYCRGCGEKMVRAARTPKPGQLAHCGQGLCSECYPALARKQSPTKRAAAKSSNHPHR